MSMTGISAFDSTLQTTNIWLNELMEKMGWTDRQRAYHALRVVLHALRDRLSVEQVAALGAQLPMLVRGFYYEGWHPSNKPVKERKKEEFLLHIAMGFRDMPEVRAEEITRAVFQVIADHVTPGEINHVRINLPGEIRSLWAEETHCMWF
jgi:uncharacterized protein (DUF2267 family)